MSLPPYRMTNLLLFILAAAGIGFALILQHGFGLEPCPLCVLQRLGVIALAVVALAAFIANPKGALMRRVFALFALLGIGWSVVTAARHVWIQHLPPDKVPSCGPGLNYWLDTLPLKQVLSEVFAGSGECAKIDAMWLGLSLPEWSLIFFGFLALICLWQLLRPVPKSSIFI